MDAQATKQVWLTFQPQPQRVEKGFRRVAQHRVEMPGRTEVNQPIVWREDWIGARMLTNKVRVDLLTAVRDFRRTFARKTGIVGDDHLVRPLRDGDQMGGTIDSEWLQRTSERVGKAPLGGALVFRQLFEVIRAPGVDIVNHVGNAEALVCQAPQDHGDEGRHGNEQRIQFLSAVKLG